MGGKDSAKISPILGDNEEKTKKGEGGKEGMAQTVGECLEKAGKDSGGPGRGKKVFLQGKVEQLGNPTGLQDPPGSSLPGVKNFCGGESGLKNL